MPEGGVFMTYRRALVLILATLVLVLTAAPGRGLAAPEGQLVWGVHVSLAPLWFDPADTIGMITPFMVFYALHDAMVKPMPGQPAAPSLAESWSVSKDGLVYEFVLRKGSRFHNGEPVTAEDVKFSFDRYRGTSNKMIKERVAVVEAPDPARVRFRLKQPWPDFLTFYSSATGAGWIVPKKYVEKVGDEGFKKAPVGAGPYKFVSFTPGVELVLEAFDQAAFFSAYSEKKRNNIIQGASGAFRNAATRLDVFVVTGGTYVYGSYPDLDGLFREQAAELDRKRREAILHKMQQVVVDRVSYAPIWELAFLNGVGPRVRESGLGLITGHAYSAPYEDVTLKGK
jgi:ABC-type transport system substrate-binding protein